MYLQWNLFFLRNVHLLSNPQSMIKYATSASWLMWQCSTPVRFLWWVPQSKGLATLKFVLTPQPASFLFCVGFLLLIQVGRTSAKYKYMAMHSTLVVCYWTAGLVFGAGLSLQLRAVASKTKNMGGFFKPPPHFPPFCFKGRKEPSTHWNAGESFQKQVFGVDQEFYG